jgi:hypothetical protein
MCGEVDLFFFGFGKMTTLARYPSPFFYLSTSLLPSFLEFFLLPFINMFMMMISMICRTSILLLPTLSQFKLLPCEYLGNIDFNLMKW